MNAIKRSVTKDLVAHIKVFGQEHLHPLTSNGVAVPRHSQVMRMKELVYKQCHQGTTLGQMDSFKAVERLLNERRLSNNDNNFSYDNDDDKIMFGTIARRLVLQTVNKQLMGKRSAHTYTHTHTHTNTHTV